MHDIDTPGLWYLPEDPTNPVAGTLHYSVESGLTLSLIGTLGETSNSMEPVRFPVIYGLIDQSPYEGSYVTLVDSFRKSATWRIPGFKSESIRANRAYIGRRHIAKEKDGPFISARATYHHLDVWSHLTGFRGLLWHHDEPGVIAARYERPPHIEFSVGETTRARIEAETVPSQENGRLILKEQVELTWSDTAGFGPMDVMDALVSPFQDFLTFAVDAPSALRDVAFVAAPAEGQPVGEAVNLVFQPVYRPQEAAATSIDMLFTWPQVAANHPNVIERWLTFRKEFKAPCDVYFGLLYGPPAYIETRFLLLATALGMFLAERLPSTTNIQEALASLRRTVAGARERLWVEMIPPVAELALPQGIWSVIDDYSQLVLPAVGNEAARFVGELVEVRRHLFQLGDDRQQRRSMQERLLRIIEQLGLLTKIRVLECLGFSGEEITRVMSKQRRYLHLVREAN